MSDLQETKWFFVSTFKGLLKKNLILWGVRCSDLRKKSFLLQNISTDNVEFREKSKTNLVSDRILAKSSR